MKQIFYFLVLFVLITSCSEDSDLSGREMFFGDDANPNIQIAKNYNAFATSQRTTLFLENFNNNNNNWPILLPNSMAGQFQYYYINNGKYKMKGDNSTFYQSSILKTIDQNKDFEIEVSLSIFSNGFISNNGIAFGHNNIDNGYFISVISQSKNLKVTYNSSSGINVEKEFTTNITDYDWANGVPIKITCRKVNQSMLFFVNENYLGKIIFEPFVDNYIGLRGLQETHFDYIKIDYLTF